MFLRSTFLTGRINRATYTALLLVYVVLAAVFVALKIRVPGEVLLAFIAIPRLHDLGRSGWWFGVILLLAIAALSALWLPFKSEDISGLAAIIVLLIQVVALAWIPGQPAANRFGAPPAPGASLAKTARIS